MTHMKEKIIALHGFLGLPSDFDVLNLDVDARNILTTRIDHFLPWARDFNRSSSSSILMGYSMGGRLALHCLIENPEQYSKAIIMAAHPGLNCLKARRARVESDAIWAERCLTMPWHNFVDLWNEQPVLKSSAPLLRNEHSFDRQALANCLRYFSLGHQESLAEKINSLDLPILWLVPSVENAVIAQIKLKHHRSRIISLPNSGHRFVFEKPLLIRNHIVDFLD